jgi:vacuolar-type H+-ATPase subunit F/Vma7
MTSRATGVLVGVVTTPAVALGYRAAGLRPRVAASVEEAQERLAEMSREGAWGVVLIQEELLGESGWTPVAGSPELPIVVPFPGPAPDRPADEASAYVAELLRRAVGYRVRLR